MELTAAEEARRVAFHGLVGASDGMRRAYSKIETFGPSGLSVLITGETGTGKTLAARAIHEASGVDGRFVAMNCAGLGDALVRAELFGHRKGAFTGAVRDREGRLARADGGTLFLDEVAELPLAVQAMLLRALEEGRYRPVGSDRVETSAFRLVAATNRDLAKRVEEGAFRSDLRHRLGVARVHLPPLREREGDVVLLAREFLRRHGESEAGAPDELTPEAVAVLEEFRWPGNVRQLEGAVKASAVLARGERAVDANHVREVLKMIDGDNGEDVVGSLDLERALERRERTLIRRALKCAEGHREQAAELLSIGVSTLYRKMASHGIGGASDGE